jgi:hypothetical protein
MTTNSFTTAFRPGGRGGSNIGSAPRTAREPGVAVLTRRSPAGAALACPAPGRAWQPPRRPCSDGLTGRLVHGPASGGRRCGIRTWQASSRAGRATDERRWARDSRCPTAGAPREGADRKCPVPAGAAIGRYTGSGAYGRAVRLDESRRGADIPQHQEGARRLLSAGRRCPSARPSSGSSPRRPCVPRHSVLGRRCDHLCARWRRLPDGAGQLGRGRSPQVSFRGARGINTLLAAAHTARLRALDFGLVGVRAELSAIG